MVDTTRITVAGSVSIAFSNEVIMPIAFTIGRFQPPTIGHKSLIERVKTAGVGGQAYVFVSSTTTPKEKNPLESADKMPILKHLVPEGVNFVDTATCNPRCGGALAAFTYLVKHEHHDPKDIVLVVGNDHTHDFGPEAPIWNGKEKDGKPAHRFGPGGEVPEGQPLPVANFVLIPSAERKSDLELKDADNMSGTKARQYVKLGRIEDFYMAVGYSETDERTDAKNVYNKIAGTTEPPVKRVRRGGEEPVPEVATNADAEFNYGGKRRKTRRRCRKCGLFKPSKA